MRVCLKCGNRQSVGIYCNKCGGFTINEGPKKKGRPLPSVKS